MPAAGKTPKNGDAWIPIRDPETYFSTGIIDFDRLLGGGFQRGSVALFGLDETVGREDLDLLLLPTLLNFLYQSRGIIAVLPSRDSPHDFRARLTQFVTRRRFDSRVRVVDYVGEDEGHSYVVSMKGMHRPSQLRKKEIASAVAKLEVAERAAAGSRKNPIIELTAFEVFETLMGVDTALRMYFHGIKRVRMVGNLGIGLLGPGLGCAAGVRRMVDSEFALHRDEVGLVIRGIRPSFPGHVVTVDSKASPPHVAFVPRPV